MGGRLALASSGSGESANKVVVETRLKGAGMHWKRENVNAMLALRNAVCNDRWAAAWAASSTCHQQQRHQRRYNRTRASVQPRFLPVPAALVAFLSATRTDDDGSCLASVSGNTHLNCTPGGFAAAASCCHPSLEASFQQPFEESCPCKTLNPTPGRRLDCFYRANGVCFFSEYRRGSETS